MTTSNDDQTTQLPEFDETMPLLTTPAPSVGTGQDATTEMPTSSPDLSSDPLAIFRESPTTQMPADPFRADAGAEGQAGASGAQGAQAQAGAPRWLCRHGRTHRLRPGLHGRDGSSGARGRGSRRRSGEAGRFTRTGCPDVERSERTRCHLPAARGPP